MAIDAIISNWRIDFDPLGLNVRLLDFGDEITEELSFPVEQKSTGYDGAARLWGSATADGGMRRSFAFTKVKEYATHAALRNFCLMNNSALPYGLVAPVRVSVKDGVTVDYADAVLHGDEPTPITSDVFLLTTQSFRISCGEMTLVAGMPYAPGLPWAWILDAWDDLDTFTWDQMG